jgi:hypothetical protein
MRREIRIVLGVVLLGLLGATIVLVGPVGWFESKDSDEESACVTAMREWLEQGVAAGNNPVAVDEVTEGVTALLGGVPESFWPTVGGLQANLTSSSEVSAEVTSWCNNSGAPPVELTFYSSIKDLTDDLVTLVPCEPWDLQSQWLASCSMGPVGSADLTAVLENEGLGDDAFFQGFEPHEIVIGENWFVGISLHSASNVEPDSILDRIAEELGGERPI